MAALQKRKKARQAEVEDFFVLHMSNYLQKRVKRKPEELNSKREVPHLRYFLIFLLSFVLILLFRTFILPYALPCFYKYTAFLSLRHLCFHYVSQISILIRFPKKSLFGSN